MIWIGLVIGAFIGILAVSLCQMAGNKPDRACALARNALAMLDDGDVSNARYALAEIAELGEDE